MRILRFKFNLDYFKVLIQAHEAPDLVIHPKNFSYTIFAKAFRIQLFKFVQLINGKNGYENLTQ